MAGARIRHSPCCNSHLGGEDKLARGPLGAPTKGSNTPTLSSPVSWAQTPASPPALAPSSTEKLCQQLLKSYTATVKLLEQNHGPSPCE